MKKIFFIAVLFCIQINIKAERKRTISTDEYYFALSLFPREFAAQYEITITDETSPANGAYYVRPTVGKVIGGGYIRMNMGNLYENCLATEFAKQTFAHELTHVWQIKHFGLVWYNNQFIKNQFICATIKGKSPYKYDCDLSKNLSNYNAEQQGDIVREYYLKTPCETEICNRVFATATWRLMIGSNGRDIAQSDNGSLYLTNTAGNIYQFNGREWSQLAGSDAVSIAANANKVVITNTAGKIYQWLNNSWEQMPGSDARDVAVGGDGSIWMVNTVGKIYKFNGTKWNQMAGSDAARIAAGGGLVYITNTAGKIYKLNGSRWEQMAGSSAADITTAGNGNLFITNTVGKIYQWDGSSSWVEQDGSAGTKVSANNEKLFLINTEGRIYTRTF
jgi:hypothetical protein